MKKYHNLSQGSDKLKGNLDALLISDATKGKAKTFNPLKDDKPRKTEEVEQLKKEIIPTSEDEIKKVKEPSFILKKTPQATPDDFKSHSSLYSKDQLNRLRNIVYMKKATVDSKYTIKEALYEAFFMLMENRQELTVFPEDFFTYSAMVSVNQWGKLNSFVYKTKAKKDNKYALKYAIYEAIEMYIAKNTIN